MNRSAGRETHIVLVGGGHAHVLSAFALQPEPGVQATLITRELLTPYGLRVRPPG